MQLEQEVVGLAGSQEEQPVPLAGQQLQVEPHRARGVRQRHLHEAVPEERGWVEKGERSGREGHLLQALNETPNPKKKQGMRPQIQERAGNEPPSQHGSGNEIPAPKKELGMRPQIPAGI